MSIRIDQIVHFTKRANRFINFDCQIIKPIPDKKGFMVGAFTISPNILILSAALDVNIFTIRDKIYLTIKELAANLTGLDVKDLRIDGKNSSLTRIVVIRSR
ncbi:hypothetical protein A2V49_02860 [candidate division WWE3 bacterium RBG_19FT_COMBO_34_6]|uniref:Uncharacterized protein n=1 Tax=candidate division WWE3 bacterium RBG_19FT_COMBO_34_6 TaxID=1802612 RepID=A0A1F4UNA8_UNCKA|nr:MAG: hypothetical protein A2V49_02860 [candidate division WWE3 bacterium RBG_19FT_COMBO_34_6]